MASRTSKQRLVMIFSLTSFFLVILFPVWGWLLPQTEENALEENRSLAELNLSGPLKNRIKTLEEYLNDHLAFRETAITAVLRANLDLGESPHPSVLSGFDGWLYYREGGEDFRHSDGLDAETLRALYDVQQQAVDTFVAAGIDYRILVAPDKHTIYPQYLPLSSRLGTGVSILEQMMTPPGTEYSVRFVDVRNALAAAAETEGQQYYKTDTHWNACGAYTAYQALMDALAVEHPTLHRLTEADVVRSPVTASGDLAAMIGQKGLREDHCEAVYVRNPVSEIGRAHV